MNLTPTRKTGSGALAGAVAIILVWLIGLCGVTVPPEIAAAFATISHFTVAWLVPDAEG